MGSVRPVLKWAGGKTQLIPQIREKIPKNFNTYFESFFGGGALFFHLLPMHSVISDSNEELINLYKTIASNVDEVIKLLRTFVNSEEFFYQVRGQDRDGNTYSDVERSARTIYLNRTCYNGLYRVNKLGQFNTPFGNYKNPKICDETNLRAASEALQNTEIIKSDFAELLLSRVEKDDLVFLDPPYIPVSQYSDFKRYTKEQFSITDHERLQGVIDELHNRGAYVILTNSNHEIVHDQYSNYEIEVIPTKRNINSKGDSRTSEDALVTIFPK